MIMMMVYTARQVGVCSGDERKDEDITGKSMESEREEEDEEEGGIRERTKKMKESKVEDQNRSQRSGTGV